MKQNSLGLKGLSLSEAQSISNQCYQKSLEITSQINSITNYRKLITIDGKVRVVQNGTKVPENIKDLILLKSKLSAVQGFLMENIKLKDLMLRNLQNLRYVTTLEGVEYPEFEQAKLLETVDEDWGWEQLTVSELAEYLEADSYSAHIGQFIHKNSKLSNLREELPKLPAIEWMELETSKKTPIDLDVFHTSEQLLKIHEEFAELHRGYENRVNYFKAKVKNLVTVENARIAEINGIELARVKYINAEIREKYNAEQEEYNAKYEELSNIFEKERQAKIKEASALKIEVHPIFQAVIDEILVNKKK